MKKILLAWFVLLAMIICPVAGTSLTFQNPADFTSQVTCILPGAGSCSWSHNTTGGNSFVVATGGGAGTAYVVATPPANLMSYSAASRVVNGLVTVALYDGTYTAMDTLSGITLIDMARCEVYVVGGTAYLYVNGVLQDTSIPLAQNPSYIGWGAATGYYDDIVWGTLENRYVFGMPESGFYLKKDMINPSASGLYYPNGTLASSFYMTTTFGKPTNASENVVLQNFGTAATYATYPTTAGKGAGVIQWNVFDALFDSGAPYGYYVITIPGSGEYSDVIPYIAYGASVAFDRSTYARGDTAVVTYTIDSLGYWNTALYSYRIDLIDVYGNVVSTSAVTEQTGSKSFSIGSSDPLGVYYAVLIATPLAGGDDIWMNYDTSEVTGYLVLTGAVYNAETGNPIPVANVSIVQGSTAFNKVTSVDGNYTTNTAFYSGSATSINVTSTGFAQYTYSFTPLDAKTIGLNFTLVPSTPSFSGIALGGVFRDNVYGNPVSGATVSVTNATHGESYTSTTNSAGYYLMDASDGITFTNGRCYTVTGSKTRYSASTHLKCVVGV